MIFVFKGFFFFNRFTRPKSYISTPYVLVVKIINELNSWRVEYLYRVMTERVVHVHL